MCCAVFQCVTTYYKACHIISYKLLFPMCYNVLPASNHRKACATFQPIWSFFQNGLANFSFLKKKTLLVFSRQNRQTKSDPHILNLWLSLALRGLVIFSVTVSCNEWKERRKCPHNFIIEHFDATFRIQ